MKKNDLSLLHKIIKQVKIANKTSVKVGLPEDVGVYTGTQAKIVNVGYYHEFGRGVPKRSFLKLPFYREQKTIAKALKDGFKSILKGGDAILNLNKIGILAQGISKNSFKNQGYGKWEALQERTIEAKGSSKILIDTGRLVQSITYWVSK